jgi:4-hydroxy-tetrahydrodipicolinate synthase
LKDYSLISAIGTPLSEQEDLHVEGLEHHVHDQWAGGVTGILAGGTMGAMQMLTADVYSRLLRHAVQFSRGRGEVMVGIGDTSLARTMERAQMAADAKADAVVVLCPYFIKFTQEQLIGYFTAVAARSRLPVYLYDVPARTGTAIEPETVARLSEHHNIVGIKSSREVNVIRRLIEMDLPGLTVIAAQPELLACFRRSARF